MNAMKFLRYLIFAAVAFFAAGCSAQKPFEFEPGISNDGTNVDWYPVELMVYVQDQNGTDLLDPDTTGCIAEGSGVAFMGSLYTDPFETRSYRATLRGFSFRENQYGWYLYFGEIDGAKDYDEDIVITWGDGSVDTIHYACSDHQVSSSSITCSRSWTLNGLPTSNPVIITKNKVKE